MQFRSLAAIACAVAVAAAGGASSALGTTVSPAGAYVLSSSGGVTWTYTSLGLFFTCVSSSMTKQVATTGAISVAPGGWTHNTCTNAVIGSFTIAQPSTLTGTVSLPLSGSTATGVGFHLDVPAGGLQQINRDGTCTIGLRGSVDKLLTLGTPSAPPITVSTALSLTVTGAFTVISKVGSGVPCSFLSIGSAIGYRSTHVLNRAMTVGP